MMRNFSGLKTTLVFAFLAGAFFSNAQNSLFYFNENSTTLSINTGQSPAHWYIEIYNSGSSDTTLRWIAHFNRLQPEWKIGFNDQTNNFMEIADGDSADFTLFHNPSSIQRLVISNTLNGAAGRGTVWFDVFDPETPSMRDTIEYVFEVAAGSSTSAAEMEAEALQATQTRFGFLMNKTLQEATCHIYDLQGRLIESNVFSGRRLPLKATEAGHMYILIVSSEKETLRVPFIQR